MDVWCIFWFKTTASKLHMRRLAALRSRCSGKKTRPFQPLFRDLRLEVARTCSRCVAPSVARPGKMEWGKAHWTRQLEEPLWRRWWW